MCPQHWSHCTDPACQAVCHGMPVQGVTDFIIFIFVASGSFLAGSLHNNLGWEIMMFYTSIPISILFLSIVFINPREIKAI